MNKQINTGEIVIYQTEDGQASLEVNLAEDTVWLDAHQMAGLFQRDRTVILRHVRNIYKTGELLHDPTCAKIAQVAQDGKKRVMNNSLRGTQFRVWANRILKDYLVTGYALNEKRLQTQIEKYEALKQSIKLIDNMIDRKLLSTSESEGLLRVIGDFSYALDTLDRYDYGKLELGSVSDQTVKRISYEEAKGAIKKMLGKFGDSALFGREKDNSFNSSGSTQHL